MNDDDLTYCKLRLDDASLHTLRTGGIAELESPLTRALCWSAAWDMTRDAELPTRDYIAMVVAGAAHETDIGVMQSLIRQALRALEIFAEPGSSAAGYAALADAAVAALDAAPPGSDHQLAWIHALLGSTRSAEHIAFVRGLLDGSTRLEGLAVDDDLRWSMVQTLSALGAIGRDDIDAELERDPSAAGQRHAATARALQPTPEAKAEAWRIAVDDDSVPNAMQEAVIAGFAHADAGRSRRALRRALLRRHPRCVGAAHQRARAERHRRALPQLVVDHLGGHDRGRRHVPGRVRRAVRVAPAGQRGAGRRPTRPVRARGRRRGLIRVGPRRNVTARLTSKT